MKKQITTDEATLKLADLCARSEQCPADLMAKMLRWGLTKADATQIIDYLTDNNFVNEERFARAFVNDKVRYSRWGLLKVRHALAMKRIPADVIRAAIESVDRQLYFDNARFVADRLLRDTDLTDPKSRDSFCRKMASRGYEWVTVSKVLSDLTDDID